MRTFDDRQELEIAIAFVEVTGVGPNLDAYHNFSMSELERITRLRQLEKIRDMLLALYFKKTSNLLAAAGEG